ncbi:MAG: DUF485 domain-containing protein [Spirochaetaceae bacterium]|nr:MAG: DUF485 domain-containing protein [Spirochaetaceae bacterium]
MSHGPSTDWGEDKSTPKKTRLGLILFAIYGIIYAAFIAINTIAPKVMGVKILLGLNLAVIYGFTLILLPIIMGLVYSWICTGFEKKAAAQKKEGK